MLTQGTAFGQRSEVPSSGPPITSLVQRQVTGDANSMAVALGTPPNLRVHFTPVVGPGTATVYPTGTYIVGHELIAPQGGFASAWNVQLENWDPMGNGPSIALGQVKITSDGFLGQNAAPPNPGCDLQYPFNVQMCSTNANCTAAFEKGSQCSNGICFSAFINHVRPDWLFAPMEPDVSGGASSGTTGPLWGAKAIGAAIPDDHLSHYYGTLILGVPTCAAGSYALDFLPEQCFFLDRADPAQDIPIAAFFSGRLTISSCFGAQADVCPKNRYLSIPPRNVGQAALRVTMLSLHHPNPPNDAFPAQDFSSHEGEIMFVGPAGDHQDTELSGTTFKGATLQCSPVYADWGTLGTVHVTGAAIIPSSEYRVEALAPTCAGTERTCQDVLWSTQMATTRWSDVVAPFQVPGPGPVTQPNVNDIVAVIDKQLEPRDRPILETKPRVQLHPNEPNMNTHIDIVDVANVADAFRGLRYPYSGPTSCP